MRKTSNRISWHGYAFFGLFVIITPFILSVLTGLWVFTAVSIGFLFGFVLQKGQLCGASAFSEIIMMKDREKLWGLWIAVVTGMGVFALGSSMGWHSLSVKPFAVMNMGIGGIVFGAGTVLAGGCVSGCLYKSAEGNLNSIIALIGIAIGVSSVEYGHLNSINTWMKKTMVIENASGGPVSLGSLTNLPYWVLAAIFIMLTICMAFYINKKSKRPVTPVDDHADAPSLETVMTKKWKPWKTGIAIGILGLLAYMSSAASGRNYPLGVTHGVLFVHTLATSNDYQDVYQSQEKSPKEISAKPSPTAKTKRKVVWWLVLLVSSLVLGSWVSARMSGGGKLSAKPPEQVVIAFFGGLLVGIGAAFAGGCVVGNIMSGWALMSLGCVLFGIFTILSNWTVTYLYLMGGWE